MGKGGKSQNDFDFSLEGLHQLGLLWEKNRANTSVVSFGYLHGRVPHLEANLTRLGINGPHADAQIGLYFLQIWCGGLDPLYPNVPH